MLSVDQVLNAKSGLSLRDQVNHNCLIDGVLLHPEYGIIFTLHKFTTGVQIYLDIINHESNNNVVLSQGRGYQRFPVGARLLWELRPSVRTTIRLLLDIQTDHGQGNDRFQYDMTEVLHDLESTKHACTPEFREYIQELASSAPYAIPPERHGEEQERQEEVVLVIE